MRLMMIMSSDGLLVLNHFLGQVSNSNAIK